MSKFENPYGAMVTRGKQGGFKGAPWSHDPNTFKHLIDAGAEGKESRSKFHPMLWDEYSQLPEPEWLIEGVLPAKGIGVNPGTQQSFKTFGHLDWCFSIAAGSHPTLKVTKQGATAFCIGEDPSDVCRRRVASLFEDRDIKDRANLPFYLIQNVPVFQNAADIAELVKQLKATGTLFRLIVIDTMARAMRGLNQNDARDAGLAMEAMECLRREFDCLVLGTHHVGHGDGTRSKGSTTFIDDVDVAWLFQGDRHTRMLRLTNLKMKGASPPPDLFFKGRAAGESLVFDQVERKVFDGADDPYGNGKIGAALHSLKAFGKAHAVKTPVLACQLIKLWGELEPDHAVQDANERTVANRLNERVKKGHYGGYLVHLVGEPVKPHLWFLPEQSAADGPQDEGDEL